MKRLFLLVTVSVLFIISACKLTQEGRFMPDPSELKQLEDSLPAQPSATWSVVGGGSYGYSAAGTLAMSVYNGVSYVAYSDPSASFKLTVKSSSGTTWTTLGSSGVSAGEVYNVSIAAYNANAVYVVYRELVSPSPMVFKPVVKVYDGATWQDLDISSLLGATVSNAWVPKIAVYDDNGTPAPFVVAGNKVMYYNGVDWFYFGPTLPSTVVEYPKIGVYDDNGFPVPYIAYHDDDAPNPSQLTVVKYNSGTGVWNFVGSRGFTYDSGNPTDTVGNCEFYLTATGTPYVFYNYMYSNQSYVKKFNGTAWVNVGSTGVTGTLLHTSMSVDETTNNVYISYHNPTGTGSVVVKKYDNGTANWSSLSFPTTGWSNFTNIVFSNAVLYVTYEDHILEANYVKKYQ